MSKAGQKLLRAAEEARRVAQCEHDLLAMPDHLSPAGFTRTLCAKCGASFYEPMTNGQRETREN